MKRLLIHWITANLLFLLSLNALACGYCLQDRIASVYDHVLVTQTRQLNQKMLYLVWDGPADHDEKTRRTLIGITSQIKGVTKGSVRVSLEPPTIGLAYQPLSISSEQIETVLLQKLRAKKIVVSVLPE
jgi:hypothetical protein